MPATRQLVAIMFADIAGYTATMQHDETLAHKWIDKLKKKLTEEVTKHHGRILEVKGDGALCYFSSTIEGIKAALAIQSNMQKNPIVPLRIGMHTGDVVIDDDTVYGDGVNIASRLESFAVPGSIFISGRVHDDIKNQKDIETVSLGKFALKNVKKEVEIFAISNKGLIVPDTSLLEGKGEKLYCDCVLVLPFVNLSNDRDQDYFSDGLTEELISKLSGLKDVKVISRTTSMLYKNTSKDVKTIVRETGASYIMEGSVRKHENNLRITAQFIDATRDIHLWSESFSGTINDIFDIQEKVSVKIAAALRMHLSGADKDKLRKRYTENTEAYQLYLQGRFFWNKRNAAGLKSAIKHFEKAIEKDPDYALAWTGLADTYSLMAEYTNISRREVFPKQIEAVHNALQIDNKLGEAHISLAIALMLKEWDWQNAEKEFKLGLELSPNYATGHHWYAEWLLFTGNMPEAYKEICFAVELDPVSQGILKDKAIYFYYNRQYDEALEVAKNVFDLEPAFAPAHRLLSLIYQGKKMYREAIAENELWGKLTGDELKTNIALAQIYAAAARDEEAKKILATVTLEKLLGSNDYRGVALIYAGLGDNDMAFEWLEKSYAMHEESLCSLKIDPKVDALRSDTRFKIFLKKIGLGG